MTIISTRRSLLVAALLLAVSAAAVVWADPPIQVGRLSLISGEVSFRPGSLDDWAPATLNFPLTVGDSLWADAGGRAEVHVSGAAIRLNSDTEFSFLNLDDQTVQIRLSQGSLNVRVRSIEQGDAFEIDTPNSSISLLSEGSYRVDVLDSGDTVVTVRRGEAQLAAGENVFNVSDGQSGSVSGAGSVAYYVQDVTSPDEWDTWCASRDQRDDRVTSVSYVSRDMIGMEDLDDHGTWLVVAGYGQVWAPSGVPSGWAPYRFGRWAWVEPWGWTWIDDAPWGFAPFHYGRWAYTGRGWVWVPGTMVQRPIYAPALVVFVGGNNWSPADGDGIGWFPLGPHEAYVPPYAVSPGYAQRINVTHVTNFQSTQGYDATRVTYVNRTVPQAVTVVHREDFVQSRRTSGVVVAVPFAEVGRAPVMGMTALVVPRRESVTAQPIAPQTRVVRPPENVASRSVFSRRDPAPLQVPFAARQQAFVANPGRPLSREELDALDRSRPTARAPVTVLRPGSANGVDNPSAGGGQRPAPAPAPGGAMIAPAPRPAPGPAMTPPPSRNAPAPGGAMIAPAPRPAPGPAMTPPPSRNAPAPGGTMIAPAPRPAPGPAMTPPPSRNAPAPGGTMIAPAPRPAPGPAMTPPPSRNAPAPGGTMIAPAPRPAPGPATIAPPSRNAPVPRAVPAPRAAPGPAPAAIAPGSRAAPALPSTGNNTQRDERVLPTVRGQRQDQGPQPDKGPQVDRNKPDDKGQQSGSPQADKAPQGGSQSADRGQQEDRTKKPDPNSSQAASMISALKTQALPKAEGDLAAAQKTSGVRLDFNALSKQLASAQSLLAGAEKDLSAGDATSALQKATSAQKQIADVEGAISAAAKPGGSSQDNRKGGGPSEDKGDNRVKPRGGG